jgi:hypothetical protein
MHASSLSNSSEICTTPGLGDSQAVEDFGTSHHQIHVKLVVLAPIRVVGAGNHRPRFAPPAAAAGGGGRGGTF